jgi:uncharacterized protein (DUF983 family)
MAKYNCPHCEADQEYDRAWEALESIETCEKCDLEYQLVDSEGGPIALDAIPIVTDKCNKIDDESGDFRCAHNIKG